MAEVLLQDENEESPNNKNGDTKNIEERFLSKLEPIIEDTQLPKEEKKEKVREVVKSFSRILIQKQVIYKAPYPPPDLLKHYNSALPDGAERIMSMVEKQSNHRIALESKIIPKQSSESGRGQIFGFILAILCLISAFILAMNGHDWVAGIIGGTTIIGLITVFVLGKEEQKENLSEKDIEDED
jgi:uncharacterized membrane protein